MTRLKTEGFEGGDLGCANTAISATYVGPVPAGTNRPSGSYCWNGASTSGKLVGFDFAPSSEIYFTVAVRRNAVQTSGAPVTLYDPALAVLGSIRTTYDNTLQLYIGTVLVATCVETFTLGDWFVLEAHWKIVNNATGVVQVKLDGHLVIDYVGDTQPGTTTTASRIAFASANVATGYDDFALNDTSGTIDNTWLGDLRMVPVTLGSDGSHIGLTGSDGNQVDNYLLVDEPQVVTTDYCEGAVVDLYDLYRVGALSLTDITIQRLWVEARAVDTVAAGGKCALGIKPSGGTEDWDVDMNLLLTTTNLKSKEYVVNPADNQPWEVSDISNALEIGFKVR